MQASSQELSPGKAPPLPAQRLLGRYEILERLAVGGMAEIYRARTRGPRAFEKTVALKRILPQNALDPDLLQMFLDEARLMASLNHPNIAQVYDIGEDEELPFFTMELVQGVDLRALLRAYGRGQPLPLEHALGIAMGVAAGLHHAHERTDPRGGALGIVHRDISPSNVLVSFEGGVKITDFGVAKWTGQNSRTEAGQLKGKLAHMSPEQCRGQALDRRTDVFALGTLLFEMLTGRPAFEAESDYELLQRIVTEDAPPLVLADGRRGARDLEEIVRAAMRRDRTLRTPTAQLVQLALEDFARRHQLVVSSVALAETVAGLFADKRRAAEEAERRWREETDRPAFGDEGKAHPVAAEVSQPTRTRTAVAEEPGRGAQALGSDAATTEAPGPVEVAARTAAESASSAPQASRRGRWALALAVAAAGIAVAWRASPHVTAERPAEVSARRATVAPSGASATATRAPTPARDEGPSAPSRASVPSASVSSASVTTPPAPEEALAPARAFASSRGSASRRSRPIRSVPETEPVAAEAPTPLPPEPLPSAAPSKGEPPRPSSPLMEKPRPKVWDPDSPVPP